MEKACCQLPGAFKYGPGLCNDKGYDIIALDLEPPLSSLDGQGGETRLLLHATVLLAVLYLTLPFLICFSLQINKNL